MMPWKLIEDPSGYIYTWLVGYSALLGPIGGILIADYYLLRRTTFDLDGLYRHRGPYTYRRGFNLMAIFAFVLAVLPNLPGFLHQIGVIGSFPALATFDRVYTYAWFVGFLLAGTLYLVFMKLWEADT